MIEKIREIFNNEASACFTEAIEIIHRQVHGKNGKLITSGMGKAGQIAHNIATTFSSTGTPAAYLHPSEAQHGDLGILQENDVLLAISNSGKTREIIELIDLKNNLFPKIPLIVITGNEPYTNYFHYCYDCDRRYSCCPPDGKNRIQCQRLCKKTSWRIPWYKIEGELRKSLADIIERFQTSHI
jgi:fructoselysine-6-P-deglycase FrlB-like protein